MVATVPVSNNGGVPDGSSDSSLAGGTECDAAHSSNLTLTDTSIRDSGRIRGDKKNRSPATRRRCRSLNSAGTKSSGSSAPDMVHWYMVLQVTYSRERWCLLQQLWAASSLGSSDGILHVVPPSEKEVYCNCRESADMTTVTRTGINNFI
ncbi:hypothetical protein Tco_0924182 [Tanacetum coccineum]|uniref:Uncharacterized protein n=1 Tax=Tanacetum coccineum TaxID=301880 RepID=A0ABQ5D662_9ASTR